MTGVSPITRQTVGRTFIVAIFALGLGAFIQVSVVAWLFISRFRAAPPSPVAETAAAGAQTSALGGAEFSDPFGNSGNGSVAASNSSAAATPAASAVKATPPPKPTPIPAQALQQPEVTPQDRYGEEVEQAKTLRSRGDTYAAVTKLKEAQTLAPQNPQAFAELAMTYEMMGFAEKAAENWRKVYEMGTAAGVYYAAAEAKLKVSEVQELRQVEALAARTAPSAAVTPAPQAAPAAQETVGMGPASKLGFLQVTRSDESDAGSKEKFTLRLPVKAKPRARIDVRDVTVQVLFFDVVNNKALDRTTASVSYRWASPPVDWSDEDVETLEVTYNMPQVHVSDEDRKYYGYIASIYYKNVLQDVHSDPANLAQRAPPAKMLAPDSTP